MASIRRVREKPLEKGFFQNTIFKIFPSTLFSSFPQYSVREEGPNTYKIKITQMST